MKDNTVAPSTGRPVDRSHGRNPRHRRNWKRTGCHLFHQGSIPVLKAARDILPPFGGARALFVSSKGTNGLVTCPYTACQQDVVRLGSSKRVYCYRFRLSATKINDQWYAGSVKAPENWVAKLEWPSVRFRFERVTQRNLFFFFLRIASSLQQPSPGDKTTRRATGKGTQDSNAPRHQRKWRRNQKANPRSVERPDCCPDMKRRKEKEDGRNEREK